MTKAILIAVLGLLMLPSLASAGSDRLGRRFDAIQTGRLYDPVLTPQLNPSFQFQPNTEAMFLQQLRQGRVNVERIPETQRQYFQMQLDNTR